MNVLYLAQQEPGQTLKQFFKIALISEDVVLVFSLAEIATLSMVIYVLLVQLVDFRVQLTLLNV
jgi:hypothetical protein